MHLVGSAFHFVRVFVPCRIYNVDNTMERKECGNIEGMSNDILHSSLESPSNADLDVIHNGGWRMEDGGWRCVEQTR